MRPELAAVATEAGRDPAGGRIDPRVWRVAAVVGVLRLGLAAILLPEDAATIQKRPFDLQGFLLISPGLACFLYGLPNASSLGGASVLAVGVLLLSAFVWHALRKRSAALIDLQLFSNRTFSAAAATQFLSNGVFNGRQLLIPLFLIAGCALTAGQANGLITARESACCAPIRWWVGSPTDLDAARYLRAERSWRSRAWSRSSG